MIDGPLQYDAAVMADVAKSKAPNSPVAGRATVFIFPDLNTGNTTYKAVQRSADLISIGPMLQGMRKPVNDLSRGALVDDIVYTIALTAIHRLSSRSNLPLWSAKGSRMAAFLSSGGERRLLSRVCDLYSRSLSSASSYSLPALRVIHSASAFRESGVNSSQRAVISSGVNQHTSLTSSSCRANGPWRRS